MSQQPRVQQLQVVKRTQITVYSLMSSLVPTEQPVSEWGLAPMPYKEPTESPDWGMAPMPYKEPTESPAVGALMVDSGEAALSQPYSPSPYDSNFPVIYAGLALTTIVVVVLLMLLFCRRRGSDNSDRPFPKLYKAGAN